MAVRLCIRRRGAGGPGVARVTSTKPHRRPDSSGTQQRDGEIDKPALAAHRARERPAAAALPLPHGQLAHGFTGPGRTTFALSATPNAPCVTTFSPPVSPSTISTFVAVRPPTFTACAIAVPFVSTTNTL